MSTSACLAGPRTASGTAITVQRPARPARLPARRRTLAAPVAALDPAFVTYQLQEFALTLTGMGAVACIAQGTAEAIKAATAAYTVTAAAAEPDAVAAPSPAAAPAASALVAGSLAQILREKNAALLEAAAAAPATLELGDIKVQLQQAAAAAVAAVKSTADAVPAPAAPRPAPAVEANGDAVKPGMTVEEATKQVKDWIAAWSSEGEEAQPAEAFQLADGALPTSAAAAPTTTRVTEPSMPASAAAVLSALTADAPVAATAVGHAAAAVEDDDDFSVGEQEQVLVGAAAPAPLAPAGSEQPSAEERESAYRQRISTVMADSKLGYGATIAQQQAKAERVARALRKRVVEVGADYQSKIETLWASYESKKAEEAVLLAKSNKILQNLAELEAAEKEELAEAEYSALTNRAAQQQHGVVAFAAVMVARVVAYWQAVQRFVQQLVARFTGGSGAAGASA